MTIITITGVDKELVSKVASDIKILKSTLFGYIFYIDIPIVEISSTMIRQCYSTNETMDEYLPSNIITYIKENNLYIDN